MKTRYGFVSNSSSSSFVLKAEYAKYTWRELHKMLFCTDENRKFGYGSYDCENNIELAPESDSFAAAYTLWKDIQNNGVQDINKSESERRYGSIRARLKSKHSIYWDLSDRYTYKETDAMSNEEHMKLIREIREEDDKHQEEMVNKTIHKYEGKAIMVEYSDNDGTHTVEIPGEGSYTLGMSSMEHCSNLDRIAEVVSNH